LSTDLPRVEEAIKKRILVGNQVSLIRLVEELDRFSPSLVEHAIFNLVRNGDLREVKGGKHLIRDH
jgi:hypothetical protein